MGQELRRTGLYDLHVAQGGKMVPFAGWEMPVQYPMGVMAEHLHSRAHAGLFDVSHMGQVLVRPLDGNPQTAALALEKLIPADVLGLPEGRQRYGLFTNAAGGILDDLMIANRGDHYLLVVNAACADQDIAHLQGLAGVAVQPVTDRGLLALQGPEAAAVLSALIPDATGMRFMDSRAADWQGAGLWISRSGYTGEDGFEISVPEAVLERFAKALQTLMGSDDPQGLATELSDIGEPLENPVSGGSDDIGDISWNVPTVTLRYPSNVRGLQGHHWSSAMAMATPIAHKGATAGAKVVGATMLDLLQDESLVAEAHAYFDDIQTKDVQYESFVGPDDDPAIEKNAETMALFKDQLEALYYDPARFDNYLDQLGIEYPQIEASFIQRGR